jgi:hypothetical protein
MIELMPDGGGPKRTGRHREDTEAAFLEDQVEALEEDIDAARAAAPGAVRGRLRFSGEHGPDRPAPHGEPVRLPGGREILSAGRAR